MTFCLGIRLEDGLVGLADTRVISGNEVIRARKISTYQHDQGAMFIMTSGLRSVRDKAVTYFEEYMSEREQPVDRLFKAVNGFADQVRRVADEDKKALADSGFAFDIYSLVGGQMSRDSQHMLYMVYPQGNWVEVGEGTPYQIIGAPGYGKPVLDRTLKWTDSLQFGLKVGCLAFDSTRISAADVDFPIDVVIYERDEFRFVEQRLEKSDLQDLSNWWGERLRNSVKDVPAAVIDRMFAQLQEK
jgi:putative proteasome-type protease